MTDIFGPNWVRADQAWRIFAHVRDAFGNVAYCWSQPFRTEPEAIKAMKDGKFELAQRKQVDIV